MRARMKWPALDFQQCFEHLGERIAIKYEHLDTVPEYLIMEQAPACRIFRRCDDGWRSAYAYSIADIDRIIEWLEEGEVSRLEKELRSD